MSQATRLTAARASRARGEVTRVRGSPCEQLAHASNRSAGMRRTGQALPLRQLRDDGCLPEGLRLPRVEREQRRGVEPRPRQVRSSHDESEHERCRVQSRGHRGGGSLVHHVAAPYGAQPVARDLLVAQHEPEGGRLCGGRGGHDREGGEEMKERVHGARGGKDHHHEEGLVGGLLRDHGVHERHAGEAPLGDAQDPHEAPPGLLRGGRDRHAKHAWLPAHAKHAEHGALLHGVAHIHLTLRVVRGGHEPPAGALHPDWLLLGLRIPDLGRPARPHCGELHRSRAAAILHELVV
mmetsp:Transcript_10457/g.35491  ORF Transcript_10457/g.35491 Transcript_10457/m.35491 type:complete len:294 (-) Transcript_10457:298-1179(-)